MILKNGKIFSKGLIHNGAILINDGIIEEMIFNLNEEDYRQLFNKNQDNKVIDCNNKLILPGIIDIHSHLRDMEQSEKETFYTGTKAAAYSGITTVFNMPNTKPPANTVINVNKWMEKAQNNIYVNVGFISGVPKGIDESEIKKIIELGVIGFKIYPLSPLIEIDWYNPDNIQRLLKVSSRHQIPIFIHAAFPLSEIKKEKLLKSFEIEKFPILDLHDRLNPLEYEEKYVSFIIQNYKQHINENKLNPGTFPIIHFCHVSGREPYMLIQKEIQLNGNFRISFEVTPHHLLLSNSLTLDNDNYGKVLPPLRKLIHSKFLLKELEDGNISLIGTDHAPHTLEEKSNEYLHAPSGFPGFESYPLMLLDRVFRFKFS
ncbi:MAG: dihydroorotase family protein, partial [Candidatus Thorarchaeota archaeon]